MDIPNPLMKPVVAPAVPPVAAPTRKPSTPALAVGAPRAVMASDVGKGMGETDYRISL